MDDLPFEVYLAKGQSGLGMSLTGGDNGGIHSSYFFDKEGNQSSSTGMHILEFLVEHFCLFR